MTRDPNSTPSHSGPAPGPVGGVPQTLAQAGDHFRDGANAMGRVMNAFFDGGSSYTEALKSNDFGDQHNIGQMMQDLAKSFFERMWSANLQLQDAALDLWDVAGAFKKADARETYNQVTNDHYGVAPPMVIHNPNGTTQYVQPGRRLPDEGQQVYNDRNTVVWVDKEGKVVSTDVTAQPWANTATVDRPAPPAVPLRAPGQ
jgi:hypothetical protein